MKIGIVDLDTSHPQNWIPLERDLGHDVVGLWDGGSVHPPAYVAAFAQTHAIERIYASLDEMAAEVDCAIIHGCDWDTHIEKARPFIEAGKAVLLDKPLAGNLADLNQLRRWQAQGARIAGGSSLLFSAEIAAYLARPVAERGIPHTVLAGCGVDEFNYGIHAYALLIGILGGGVRTVQFMDQGVQARIWVRWHDGRSGLLVIGQATVWLPFYATLISERQISHVQVDAGGLYRQLLARTLPYLAGQVTEPPLPFDEWILPECCTLAARASQQAGGREIELSALDETQPGYDGASFAEGYRLAKYPVK